MFIFSLNNLARKELINHVPQDISKQILLLDKLIWLP